MGITIDSHPAAARLRRVDLAVLGVLVLLATLYRFVLVGYHPVVEQDGVHYAALARNLVHGQWVVGFSAAWSSLYPVLAAAVSLLAGDVVLAGRIVSVLAGGLTVVPLFLLGSSLYDRRIGWLAALLAAFHPTLVWYSTLVMTEALYVFLVCWVLLFGWFALKSNGARYPLLAGVCGGLAALTRPEILGYLVVLGAFMVVQGLLHRDRRREAAAKLGLLWIGILAMFLPMALVVHTLTGDWIWLQKGGAHLLAGAWYYDPVARSEAYAGLHAQPLNAVRLTPAQILGTIRESISLIAREALPGTVSPASNWFWHYLTFALVVLGIWGRLWDRKRLQADAFLGVFVGCFFFMLAITLVHTRLLTVTLIAFACWFVLGVLNLGQWAADTWSAICRGAALDPSVSEQWARRGVLVVLVVGFIATSLFISQRTAQSPTYYLHELDEQRIGMELKAVLPQETILMAPMPFIAFYFYERDPAYVGFPYG